MVNEVSFRNAGVRPYDFNKLRSIRAISMRGESREFETKRNPDERAAYNTNRLNNYEDKDKLVQQRLFGLEKIMDIDDKAHRDRILQEKIMIKKEQDSQQNNFEEKIMKRSQSINPNHSLKDMVSEVNEIQHNPNLKFNKSEIGLEKLEALPKNPTKHQKNFSLPVINAQLESETINKTVNNINKKEFKVTIVEEEKAKELVMKQLGVTNSLSKITSTNETLAKQEKINNQVLASIKMKSVNNLERLTRTRSEIVIVDKWKEKYGQSPKTKIKKLTTNLVINQKLTEKLETTNNFEKSSFLPSLQRTFKYDDDELNQNEFDLIVENNSKEDREKLEGEKNDFEKEKYENSDLEKHYSSAQLSSEKKHMFCLNHYLSREILSTEKPKDSLPTLKEEFFSNQPLKINITQIKKHERKNKQNLNLEKELQTNRVIFNFTPKITKDERKLPLPLESEEGFEKIIEKDFEKSDECKKENLNDEISEDLKSNEKVKTFLSFKEFKNEVEKKQDIQQNIKTKQKLKCKINEEKVLMEKLKESDAMIEWENKKYADLEEMEFHAFVKNRINDMMED